MACRGSGKVISNLGGTPNTVTCPWCDGSGVRTAEIDAQARWPANEDPVAPAADATGAAAGAADAPESAA